MVGKRIIEGLDFKTLDEYFEYIIDSYQNGNHSQKEKLYLKLSKKQRFQFELHCNEVGYSHVDQGLRGGL